MDERELTALILPGDRRITGIVRNISADGLKIEVEGGLYEYFLSQRRLVRVEVRSNGQPIFQSYMIVVYLEQAPDRSTLSLGMHYIGADRFQHSGPTVEDRPANLFDQRKYPRSHCEFPAILIASGGEAEQSLPVIISNISEKGCRIEGPENLDYLMQGTIIQICIEPWDLPALRVLAEVVKVHSPRVLGVKFTTHKGSPEEKALIKLVTSLLYPDLVAGQSPDAEGLWETISASGYFRERAPETYLKLHKHAVDCWSRLNSPVGRAINRTLISQDEQGHILSLCQLSQVYPHTWMGHHLAVVGDKSQRARLAPQQFGGVFDTLQQIRAGFFINYHNANHKAQSRIWIPFSDAFPQSDFSLRELLCYDISTSGGLANFSSDRSVNIRQVGTEVAAKLLPWLRQAHCPLVYDALGFEEDLVLERLDLDYCQVGLQRRRSWLMAESPEGTLLGLASMEVVPTGFNMTSIGDHLMLYINEEDQNPLTQMVTRQLVRHATDFFRRLEKPFFILMAETSYETLIGRSLGLSAMAHAHEIVMLDSLFPMARDFIRDLYREKSTPEQEARGGSTSEEEL